MPRFRETIPIDDYVLDVLMRDIVGHDRQPAAYLVFLHLYGQAARMKWKPVTASLRTLAETTGLSKSSVQTALEQLRRRKLIETVEDSRHRRAEALGSPALALSSRKRQPLRRNATAQISLFGKWRGARSSDLLLVPRHFTIAFHDRHRRT